MLTLSVRSILEVTGGELIVGDAEVLANGLSVDSRSVEPGCAFVALPGERVDGLSFAAEALASGARVVITQHPVVPADALAELARGAGAALVRVGDGVRAVQDLAAYHRSRLHCHVVGVSGSTGKTTTKDFLDAVLSRRFRTVSTSGNQNNELGVPLTLMRAGADTDALVVEMGMRGIGQIARLAEIARPTLGLLTNVGTSHIEILGSQESVVSAKGELVRAIPENGTVFLNGDDANSMLLTEVACAPVVRYGIGDECEVRAEHVALDADSRASFTLVANGEQLAVQLPVPGRHNVYNALAAAAVGLALGIDIEEVAAGLAAASSSAMRMQLFTTADGVTIVNDAYNANPASMRAAVDTLAGMRVAGRRVAVLGDMAELGSLTEIAHFEIGEHVADLGLDALITVGPRAEHIAHGARARGMDDSRIHCVTTPDAAAAHLVGMVLEPGDTVLVKASRVMQLERVVEGIVNSGV